MLMSDLIYGYTDKQFLYSLIAYSLISRLFPMMKFDGIATIADW